MRPASMRRLGGVPAVDDALKEPDARRGRSFLVACCDEGVDRCIEGGKGRFVLGPRQQEGGVER